MFNNYLSKLNIKCIIRLIDILLSLLGIIIGFPIFVIIFIILWQNTGSPFFIQIRMGKYQKPFNLIKFRTMKIGTPSVATHFVNVNTITPFGRFLRRNKLDELPQLWNVLKGEMSLVGARPNLFNQNELISERLKLGIYNFLPGITGLAQINGIDMSQIKLLAKTDAIMLDSLNLINYFKYIVLTILGKGKGDRVV